MINYNDMLVIIFFVISVLSLLLLRGTINERVELYSRGAGQPDLLLMVWIFLLAGGFAATADAMGAIDAVVNATLYVMPTSMLLPGLFLAACLISFSIGSSVGAVAALVPVAAAMSEPTGISLPLIVGAVVGGSFFGDNLSFISDTTIVATRTQDVQMRDKFIANFRIVMPAAVVAFALYVVLGFESQGGAFDGLTVASVPQGWYDMLLMLPYATVIVLALRGMNVMLVLLLGNVMCGVIGLFTGNLALVEWGGAIEKGMNAMCETIFVAMMAGGMLAVIRHSGWQDRMVCFIMRHVGSARGAEFAIAALVSATNCLTANNTVAILSVGGVCKDIANRYGIDRRRSASLLDTCSCITQGLLPYGAQVLIASGLAMTPAMSIVPYLFYNFILGAVVLACIVFGLGKYSEK